MKMTFDPDGKHGPGIMLEPSAPGPEAQFVIALIKLFTDGGRAEIRATGQPPVLVQLDSVKKTKPSERAAQVKKQAQEGMARREAAAKKASGE